jgi:hypothetical protein
MKQEFFDVVMRKKIYNSISELQQDLDIWLYYYNHERHHSGNFVMEKLLYKLLRIAKNLPLKRIMKSYILKTYPTVTMFLTIR